MKIPKGLIEAFENKKAGLFIGAGLSQAAGLPNWEGLLDELIDIVEENQYNLDSDYIDNLKSLKNDSSKYLAVAQELKDNLQDDFRKYIMKKYDDDCPDPTGNHKNIIKLPYEFILTTNYDTLLEDAYVSVFHKQAKVRTFRDSADVSYDLWENRPFILKTHGDASSPQQGIILTEKDYRNIIFNEPGYQSILQTIFSTKTILFIGSSLVDTDLNLLLSFVHNSFHGGGPKHYALMDKEKINTVEAELWRKNFNIQIIPYDPKDHHKEVEVFIEKLLDSVK